MKSGELWLLDFPVKGGREQTGKRPAMIVADTKVGMIIAIPLTSNINALKFPHTYKIQKSQSNNLEKDSVALIFQIQSLDKKRFLNKIGTVEENHLREMNKLIKELFNI